MKLVKSIAVALFMLALLVVPAGQASAKHGDNPSNPSDTCESAGDAVYLEFPMPDGSIVRIPMEIPSHGGCVSTVATSGTNVNPELSEAAYASNCRALRAQAEAALAEMGPEAAAWWYAEPEIVVGEEGGPDINLGGFGGTIASCKPILRGYHTGTLTHP